MNTATHSTGRSFSWIVPTIYIIFLLLPIYWLVNMSFKTNTEITGAFSLYPHARRCATMLSSSPIRPGITAISTRSSMW